MSLVIVFLCDYKGSSNLGFYVGYSAKTITKLFVLDFGLVQRDGQFILNLDTIDQLLHHSLLCSLVLILHD